MPEEDLPVFPNIIPSSIKESRFRVFEKGDFSTEKDLKSLMLLLYNEPECDFYYFVEQGSPADPLIFADEQHGDILMSETEFFYYRHPSFKRDYVHIEKRDGKFEWDWEREVVDKGPMYSRTKLQLSARMRTELEILQKKEMEKRPPTPIGSPYGFNDEDWLIVAARKEKADTLYAILGFQFQSKYYESEQLKSNVRDMFAETIKEYSSLPGTMPLALDFRPLAAGYGEHLFNEIARDIISADIAVFETSDLNPNVLLEMGVALTWGVMVLPIKTEGAQRPPSDISGQTWANYRDHAFEFLDPDHKRKLLCMVKRAISKKRQQVT